MGRFPLRAIVLGMCIVLAPAAAYPQRESTLLLEAESALLENGAQAQWVSGVSGSRLVWSRGGSITWDAVTPAGHYHLFLRVRAGYHGDHLHGVKGASVYRVELGGVDVPLRMLPDTLSYAGDEHNWAWLSGEVGELPEGLHQFRFTSHWHYGHWDVFILTTDGAFAPAMAPPFGPETAPDLSLLNAEERMQYDVFTVWAAPVEENCAPSSRPPEVGSVQRVTVTACRNDWAPVALNITNWSDTAITCRVTLASTGAGDNGADVLPPDSVRPLRAVPLASPFRDALADPLPRVDSGGLLDVPAGETRQLWLEIDTAGLAAGRWRADIGFELLSGSRQRSRRVAVDLLVLPLQLPREHTRPVFTFDYDQYHPGMAADMPTHYVSIYHNCLAPHPTSDAPDYAQMAAHVRREMARPGARGIWFEHWWFRSDASWKDPANRQAWVEGTRRWARFVHEDLELDHGQFTLHIYDEQTGAAVDDFVLAREIVREADPRVRVTVTLPPGIAVDELRKMEAATDVWSPFMSLLANEEAMEFLRGTGKPIWPYHCAEDKRYWPAQRYRVWSWELFRAGADGLCLWKYLGGDAWDAITWDGGMVFPGWQTIVTSRRWELLRLGLADWLILEAATAAGHQELAQQAVAEVLASPDDAELLREWRTRLAEAAAGADD